MKICLILEGKNPPDQRVPLSPNQCKEVIEKYPSINLVVQNSNVRRFKATEYEALGIKMVDSVDDCDILLGVKEVPINQLIPNKTYFYFSHTTKKQPYNADLLRAMLAKNITMVDYEGITKENGRRLIGFGRYAGIVGCYNSFLAYGRRSNRYDLKRAFECEDRAEMESELSKVKLPSDYKIVLTGTGRVSKGAGEIMKKLNIRKVSAKEFLNQTFNEPVYTSLLPEDCHIRKDGTPFVRVEYYDDPTRFECTFINYAKVANMFIACHFWDSRAPYLFSREDAKSPEFKIKIVGDISCDIDGPIACTIRPSTIADPIYAYNPQSESESDCDDPDAICVMAVDNLPCELPKDASEDFGREFIDNVLPHIVDDKEGIIERATICKDGDLTPHHEYLRDYVNGEVTA
ncbi:MAG: alanine dehydrogenase [Flavobacteriales bacterium]|nr:MAG: alanine dehydrogenase [Flavobacteriales bacterium]